MADVLQVLEVSQDRQVQRLRACPLCELLRDGRRRAELFPAWVVSHDLGEANHSLRLQRIWPAAEDTGACRWPQ